MKRPFPLLLAFCQVVLAATLLYLGHKREDSFNSIATIRSSPLVKDEPGTATVDWSAEPWEYMAPEEQVCLAINAPPTFLLYPIFVIAGSRAEEIPPLLVRAIYLILIGVFWFWLAKYVPGRSEPRRRPFLLLLAAISLLFAARGLFFTTQTYWGHSPIAFLGICVWLLVLAIWAGRYLWRAKGLRPA